jgi:hypothetical protein
MIVPLLILVLGVALGVGVVCIFWVAHYRRTNPGVVRRSPEFRRESWPRPRRFTTPWLSSPERWLALPADNPRLIREVLGLHRPVPCSWEEGLHAAQEQKLFLSPPVRGWVLVMGSLVPDPAEDIDRCFRLIHQLSLKLGQVQFFSVNRAVNHHAWVLAEQGRIHRAYAWAGQTLWNQGRMTRDEVDLGLTCYSYTDAAEEFDFRQAAPAAHNTDKVPGLAGRWSIDPTTLDGRWFKEPHGLAGDASPTIVY